MIILSFNLEREKREERKEEEEGGKGEGERGGGRRGGLINQVNKPYSCSLLVCLLPLLCVVFNLIWPWSLPETLFLAAQTLTWISNSLMPASLLPVILPIVLMTPGKLQTHHAECFSRLSASTGERSNSHCLCLVPASLNPLFNLIFKTKPRSWYSIIITHIGGVRR